MKNNEGRLFVPLEQNKWLHLYILVNQFLVRRVATLVQNE